MVAVVFPYAISARCALGSPEVAIMAAMAMGTTISGIGGKIGAIKIGAIKIGGNRIGHSQIGTTSTRIGETKTPAVLGGSSTAAVF